MFIEKSPFYKSKGFDSENISLGNQNLKKKNQDSTFSFLRWIKGAINPLQNLPLISGVYSSINSENEESDRDMVQNGIGGFLYGGPIGAVVGVGNWIFNKLFDNTPTEMFLEFTGISKIWKKKTKTGVANLVDKQEIVKRNELIHPKIQNNNIDKKATKTFPETTNFKKNYQNSKVRNKNSRSMEFDYPKKKHKEGLNKPIKSEVLGFFQIHSFYNSNKNTEKNKSSFDIRA